MIASKAEPISVIWREHLKNAQFFLKSVDSTHIYVTYKFARRYGKDCENEVHVNLDFNSGPYTALRMPSMISEMTVVGEHICFILSGYLLTFQDILECLTVYRYVQFHLVELRFAEGRLGKLSRLFCSQLCQITGNL